MKYLLLLAIVLLVVWLWRGRRSGEEETRGTRRPDPGQAQQDMVQCPVCLVHLPRSDALPGPDGQLYCCQEHRSRGGA